MAARGILSEANEPANLRKNCGEWPASRKLLARGRNSAFMDSCQLIRTETKMEVAHLNQKQLAAHWSISEATLERWRSE